MVLFPRVRIRTSLLELLLQHSSRFPPRRSKYRRGETSDENREPLLLGKRTPTSVRRRSSRVDFRLRNPSSPDVVFVMKALFSILDPQNRVETNTCFVFAHDFVLALRYLLFSVFAAYLYYRLHKISAMPPFHGWPFTTTT